MELLIMAPLALVIALVVRRQEAFKFHWRPGYHGDPKKRKDEE
jgi:hypothetical protein